MSTPTPKSPVSVVTARRVAAGEWKAFFELRLQFVENCPTAVFGNVDFMKSRPDSCWIQVASEMAAGPTSAAFLAWRANQAVGFVTVSSADRASDYKIQMLYVEPTSRRFGLGRLLLMKALGFVGEQNAQRVSLWVTEANEEAKRIYEKVGFVDSGARRTLKPGSDQLQALMHFALEIETSKSGRTIPFDDRLL